MRRGPQKSRLATLSLVAMALLLLLLAWSSAAFSQPGPRGNPPPPQVQQLLKLLEDPTVREWLDQQQGHAAPPPEPARRAVSQMLTERIATLKQHLVSLAAALPRLPGELRAAIQRLLDEDEGRSLAAVLALLGGFLVLGSGAEWLFRMATASLRKQVSMTAVRSTSERLWAIAQRFALGLSGVAIFMLASLGAFLAFQWPPLLRQVVVAYLMAAVGLRLVLLAGRFLLAPGAGTPHEVEQFRLIPISPEAATFWYRRLAAFAGWFAFGWATVDVLGDLGFTEEARQLVAYGLGLGLLAISLEATWTHRLSLSRERSGGEEPGRVSRTVGPTLLSICFILLWILWVIGATRFFWLVLVVLAVPVAIRITERAIRHALRPPNGPEAASDAGLTAIYLDRGVRALLIAGAALVLARAWGIDLIEMTSRDTLPTRLARGVLSSIVILLVADLIWQVAKTLIDRRLAQVAAMAPPGSDEALRQARLRTLLPIFRYVIFVVVAVVAILMMLSALGVEIGPLIAGAGIVGVAVGFGSQTLVRDVISGVFYLLDDAFRVGEYIQSGNYKGTVESLGFRSVKLRHHRGPIYTVPYGQLGAVQNLSRDWVIDKITVNVTYDTNLDKAKRIIRQIGKELSQDPELAPHILEPLKMQGVEQFGDFAIQLRLKMMTRPGEQFPVRRRAYAMIKKAFDENGIKFAFPTVQVAGREEGEAAAAQQVLKTSKGAASA
jgi:small-conductance mechanosensitive channel